MQYSFDFYKQVYLGRPKNTEILKQMHPIEPDELDPQDDLVPPPEPPASVSPLTS